MSFLVQLDRNAPAEKIGGKARSLLKLADGSAGPPGDRGDHGPLRDPARGRTSAAGDAGGA